MTNPGVKYRVTGRYMDGQKIVGYHLIGEDNSQSQESRDRVIYLIGKGIIINMRIQSGINNEIIIRGKGVNLNDLPIFDIHKLQYRNNEASNRAAHAVNTKNSNINGISNLGQYTITKRVLNKGRIIGYELVDYSGATAIKKRSEVLKFASERLISNAIVQRYQKNNEQQLILRGVNCDLSNLPVLIIDNNNNIIDPSKDGTKMSIRCSYMKHNGVLIDTSEDRKIPFRANDCLVYTVGGNMKIIPIEQIKREFRQSKNITRADCDDYLDNCNKYRVEIFGSNPINLNSNIISKWAIFSPL